LKLQIFEVIIGKYNKLDEIPGLKTAFEALTPGRKERTFFIFLNRNNPKLESQELKNICSKFWLEKD
jgi:uncharacterized protein YdeI (YjbR/CyaY-like superfamily)